MNDYYYNFDKLLNTIMWLVVLIGVLVLGLACKTAYQWDKERAEAHEEITIEPVVSIEEPAVSTLAETRVFVKKPLESVVRPQEPFVEEISGVELLEKEKPAEIVEEVTEEQPKLYTDEWAVALAKMAYGEARGVLEYSVEDRVVSSEAQIAATMWTALNRVDAGKVTDAVAAVAAPNQFAGYSVDKPVDDELLALAYDVLDRWNAEKYGETEVGRVIPADYLYFHGDGQHNHFRNKFEGGQYWDWSLPDVYAK